MTSMKKQFQNWTLFFIAGIIAIIVGLITSIVLITGNSAADGLFGMYLLFGLVPVLLVIIIDRILVWKFGNKNVNKVQFSILLLIVFLWIVRFVLNLFI
ncbi:hypothetical protein C1634_016825 [Chryseobacterium viscerum]|uniref:Uncharacterized protein n=2 Tax=Chryseobacterium viscerum TaxID=1037377 RepID=A0A316WMI7_9FLAO|nr:hypothetical protein C1634_016825 [Chryseobacterium viscerum]